MDEAERVAKSSRMCCVLPSFLDSCTYVPSDSRNGVQPGMRVLSEGEDGRGFEPAPPSASIPKVFGQPAVAKVGASGGPTQEEDLAGFLKSALETRNTPAVQTKPSPRTSPARSRSNSPHRPRSPRSVNIVMLVGELRTEAQRLVAEGHPEAAELVYKEALRYCPGDHTIKVAQIECVLLQGRAQEALTEAQALTAAAPQIGKGWQVEAAALAKLGQARLAVERYQRAESVAKGSDPALAQQCHAAAAALQATLND